MLLVKLTYSGTDYFVSQDGHALTHLWKQYVLSFSGLQRRLPCDYGGYCAMEAGGISFSPALFGSGDMNVWPPPASIDIEISYTATTEAAATVLISGKAHLSGFGAESVSYDIYPPDITDTAADGTAYSDTLATIAAAMASTMGLSFDATNGRTVSPTVVHTLTAERLLVDILSDFCKFYSHLFYIDGSTLYLVDMLNDNGTRSIEFKFLPPKYKMLVPVYEVTNGDHSSFGAYAYGRGVNQSAYHGTEANIKAAFDDIVTVCNKVWVEIEIPFEGTVPVPGEKISWTDDRLATSTAAWIRARHITYNFDRSLIRIEGEGEVSSA